MLTSFLSCNDGDIIVTTFNFDDTNLLACGGPGGYLFFKINTENTESLSLRLGTTNELFTSSDTLVSVLNGTANFVNYRIFDGEVSSEYFCNEVPPTVPQVVIEYIANSGSATLITITERDDVDGLTKEQEGSGDFDSDGLPNFYDRLSVFSVLILKNKYPPGPPQANKLVSSKLKVVTIISPSLQDRKEVKISNKNNFFISGIDLLKSKVTQFL